MAAGPSGTPLARKLGIGPGTTVHAIAAPPHYRQLLEPLPDDVRFVGRLTADTDVVHLFCERRRRLEGRLAGLRERMRADTAIWVSWPKKASGRATDLSEDVVRELALPLGLVDVKVCAIDATWSGLKLVLRRELR